MTREVTIELPGLLPPSVYGEYLGRITLVADVYAGGPAIHVQTDEIPSLGMAMTLARLHAATLIELDRTVRRTGKLEGGGEPTEEQIRSTVAWHVAQAMREAKDIEQRADRSEVSHNPEGFEEEGGG